MNKEIGRGNAYYRFDRPTLSIMIKPLCFIFQCLWLTCFCCLSGTSPLFLSGIFQAAVHCILRWLKYAVRSAIMMEKS